MYICSKKQCITIKNQQDMYKINVISLLVAIVLAASCATTLSVPERLDRFVEKTEKEYRDYTEADWEKSRKEYDALVAEMKENYDSYTISEKVKIAQAVGRYSTLVIGSEVSEAAGSIGSILEQIPETINGVINDIDTASIRETVEGIKASIDTAAIRKTVEGIIESIDTAKIREQIEGIASSIDTAKLREKIEAVIKIFGLE